MASNDQTPANIPLRSILNTVTMHAYKARNHYNNTYVQSKYHQYVTQYESYRIDFFFEHTLEEFDFPTNPTFNATLLKEGQTVKEFTKIFYDCFLRYNATMDMIGEDNQVTHHLKALLIELKEYAVIENIEPLKEKYDKSDVKLDKKDRNDSNIGTAEGWLRKMCIYRDFAKTMEYVQQAYKYFDHLANNAEASL